MYPIRAIIAAYILAPSAVIADGPYNPISEQPKPAEGPGNSQPEVFQPGDIELAVAGNVSAKVILHGWEGCELRAPCQNDKTKQQLVSASALEFWGSKRKTEECRDLVQENMNNLATQQSASWWDWKLHVRCDDPVKECGTITEAYTVNGGDYINFCDPYFRYTSLEETVDRIAGRPNQLSRDQLFRYRTRATVWAHELMHVASVGKTDPQLFLPNMPDFEYGRDGRKWKQYRVVDTKWLALGITSLDNAASHNPQNYAYFALANYIISRKGFCPSGDMWTSNMEPPPLLDSAQSISDGDRIPENAWGPFGTTEC